MTERDALGDRLAIPERAILLVERNQLAVRAGARGAARVGEQHQREQARDFPSSGSERVHSAREANRFVRQVGALQVWRRCCCV